MNPQHCHVRNIHISVAVANNFALPGNTKHYASPWSSTNRIAIFNRVISDCDKNALDDSNIPVEHYNNNMKNKSNCIPSKVTPRSFSWGSVAEPLYGPNNCVPRQSLTTCIRIRPLCKFASLTVCNIRIPFNDSRRCSYSSNSSSGV